MFLGLNSEFYIGFSSTLLGSYFWLSFLKKKDKFEPEPLLSLLFVVTIGGLGSTFFAIFGNQLIDGFNDVKFADVMSGSTHASALGVISLFMFSAFNEGLCKYTAAFLLIRANKQVNEPIDGIIYAVAVGLGFSLFENLIYANQFGSYIIVPRLLLAVPMHMAAAAIWGIYFSQILIKKEKLIFSNGLPLLLIATCLHGLWNSSSILLGSAFFLLAPFVLRFCLKRIDAFLNEFHEHSPFKS